MIEHQNTKKDYQDRIARSTKETNKKMWDCLKLSVALLIREIAELQEKSPNYVSSLLDNMVMYHSKLCFLGLTDV
jgi:hypothetical protein